MRLEQWLQKKGNSTIADSSPSIFSLKKAKAATLAKLGLLTFSLCLGSSAAFAVPGATQQAVTQAISAEELKAEQPVTKGKGTKVTKKQGAQTDQNLGDWLKTPGVHEALTAFLQHPYFTYTAKSIFSPAAIPMQWGGIGVAADVFNRYPSQIRDTWSGDLVIALPFGNSDKLVGGAISVDIIDMGKNTTFAKEGTVELVLSRWLAQNTAITGGVSNMIPWGPGFKQAAKTYYGAVTQYFGLNMKETHPISATFGLGTGAFSAYGELDSNGQLAALHDDKLYPFANASFNFTRNLAVMADYYSRTYAAGIAYNKIIVFPFSFQLYAANLHHTEDAPSTTYGLRVSVGFDLPG